MDDQLKKLVKCSGDGEVLQLEVVSDGCDIGKKIFEREIQMILLSAVIPRTVC